MEKSPFARFQHILISSVMKCLNLCAIGTPSIRDRCKNGFCEKQSVSFHLRLPQRCPLSKEARFIQKFGTVSVYQLISWRNRIDVVNYFTQFAVPYTNQYGSMYQCVLYQSECDQRILSMSLNSAKEICGRKAIQTLRLRHFSFSKIHQSILYTSQFTTL